MLPSEASIVQMFEELEMSPNEIALDLDYEEAAVKLILASKSKKYRESCFDPRTKELKEVSHSTLQGDSFLFTADDKELAKSAILELASNSDNDGVRLKASKTIIDEYLGRNNKATLRDLQININVLNETIIKAKRAKEAARNKVIDISPSDVKMLVQTSD